jgi:zinc protease
VVNPTFPADELNLVKERYTGELRVNRTVPLLLVQEQFFRTVFGTHPAAQLLATPEAVAAIRQEDLIRWHRERYAPQNTVLAVVGDVDASRMIGDLERAFGGWSRTPYEDRVPPEPQPPGARRVQLVDRPGSVQTWVMLGDLAIERRDPDYPVVVLLTELVRDRMWTRLREETGDAQSLVVSFLVTRHSGPWFVWASLRTAELQRALADLVAEVRRPCAEPAPREELEPIARSLVGKFSLSLETGSAVLNYAMDRKLFGFAADYWETYPTKLMDVTPADLQRVACKYFDPARLQIVAVGDAASIKPVLSAYGTPEIYDTGGRRTLPADAGRHSRD